VSIGDQALGFEGGQHRSTQPLGQITDLAGGVPGAMPGDQHRPLAGFDQRAGPGQILGAGLDTPGGYPALRRLGCGVAGLGLHLVGQDQMRYPTGIQRLLDRQRRQFGVVAVAANLRRPGSHVPEHRAEVCPRYVSPPRRTFQQELPLRMETGLPSRTVGCCGGLIR